MIKTILNEISHEIFSWRIKLLYMRTNYINKRLRRKYCNTGHHKLTVGKWSHISARYGEKIKRLHAEYLTCAHCNFKFFSSLKVKNKYLEIESATKDSFSSFPSSLSSVKSKHTNSKGKEQGEDVSVSAKKK